MSDELAPGLDSDAVARVVATALAEDLGPEGDVTTLATVDPDAVASAELVSRQHGVVAGLPVASYVFQTVGEGRVRVELHKADGDRVEPGDVLATARGPLRDLLTAERTALNLIGHLSGVASATRLWADAIAGTSARVRDTRKTMPGLRQLEKYAVRMGGGVNHRMSLSDAALVKDNHVVAAGGVVPAFEAVRAQWPDLEVEVECDTVEQVQQVVAAGADLVLLDNMTLDDLRAAVAICKPAGVRTEASGGLTLDRARAVAETGVDFLSVGALTHSAPVLDLGLDLQGVPDAAHG
ncbi:MAG: Nicotinate-nucleotide pyrophosphorylase [Frankiales bacterium]|nr:Nicotinate-nucleotide pyrophosphorylase [Frankiales bacterium]